MQISPVSFPGLSIFPHLDSRDVVPRKPPRKRVKKKVQAASTGSCDVVDGLKVKADTPVGDHFIGDSQQEVGDYDGEEEREDSACAKVQKESEIVDGRKRKIVVKSEDETPQMRISRFFSGLADGNESEAVIRVTTVTTSTTMATTTTTLSEKQIQRQFSELQTFSTASSTFIQLPSKAVEVLSSLPSLDLNFNLPSKISLIKGLSLLPASFQEFVHEQRLFEEYDKTYQDCKRRADVHKRQDPQSEYSTTAGGSQGNTHLYM